MSLYTMKLSDSVDTMEFNLLEVPIQDKDIEGAVDNVVLSGDIYTDFLWLKKRFTHKWSILCKDDYERLRGFYTRQFSNAEVPIYQLLDAPSPVEESAGSGEYIQITTTDSTAKLASVEMLGKAEQTTYSGKNLFSGDYSQFDEQGGTGSTYTYFKLPTDDVYTLTLIAKNNISSGGGRYLGFSTNGGNANDGINWIWSGGSTITKGEQRTITNKPAIAIYHFVSMYPKNQATLEWFMENFDIQLEAGNTATAYEPYVGGTPAPNPEFPMPISVVTGENVVKVVGKNIFKFAQDSGSATRNGVTIAVDSYNRLTLNGTATGAFWCELVDPSRFLQGVVASSTNFRELDPDTWYSMSANVLSGSFTAGTSLAPNFNIQIKDQDQSANQRSCDFGASTAFNTADGIYRAWLYIKSGDVFNNCTLGFQLEKGNQASQFEPYQGQEFEVNLGKNLLKPYQTSGTLTNVAGVSATMNSDGTMTLNGTATGSGWIEFVYAFRSGTQAQTTPQVLLDSTATYTLSSSVLSGTATGSPIFYIQPTSASTSEQYATLGNTKTFTGADGIYRGWFRVSANQVYNNAKIGFQVEKGSTATTYAPYFTPIELAKIGNYQDRIYKEDSKWYIEKQVGKVVLDGSETWTARGTQYTDYLGVYTTSKQFGLTSNFLDPSYFMCDHFKSGNGTYNATYGQNISSTQYAIYVTIESSITEDATAFKTWLTSHPTNVYYPLATPTTTEITNEALIAQLEALGASSLYLGVNNIGTETLNAMPTLALTYFPYYPHEIISPKAVRMELTDGGIINACECRENVQITLRETIQ